MSVREIEPDADVNEEPAAPRSTGVVVIGAGQAGLCLSWSLTQRAVPHIVLERDRPFAAWTHRWSGFRTNTPNWMNTLPMLPADEYPSGNPKAFATKAELLEYLDRCLEATDPPLETGVEVERVTFLGDQWEVETSTGAIRADAVAVCTGAMSTPRLPAAAEQTADTVRQMHSSEYRHPEQIETRRVLVVGSASSGVQICRLLGESGRFDEISLAMSNVMTLPEHVLGIQTHRLLHAFKLFDVTSTSLLGRLMYSGLETKGDPIMRPAPRDLRRMFGVQLFGRFSGMRDGRITFEDGQSLDATDLTIIWCTGFRSDYDFIDVPDRNAVFDSAGFPRHHRGVSAGVPGLYFVGLRYQHTVASHDIYGVGSDADHVAESIARSTSRVLAPVDGASVPADRPLKLVDVDSCVCGGSEASLVGTGRDFEYATSPDVFRAYRCAECGAVYLNPRPDVSEFARIYPNEYHSLEFTEEAFSVVHRIRSWLEARRLLRYCRDAPSGARILDVGCGDGFHLSLLKQYGDPSWTIEGVDIDARAVDAARARGLDVRLGDLGDAGLPSGSYDVVYTLQTIEHVAHPDRMLSEIHRLLRPGGRLVVVTDNTDSLDFAWFQRSHWGGYHFPRHWTLFNAEALSRLARTCGYEVDRIDTIVSPVNWVYSIHNRLVDAGAPRWLIDRFTLASPGSLSVFTVVDSILQRLRRGALLNGYFTKPAESQ